MAFLRLPTQTITETPILLTTQQAPGGKFTRKKEDAIAALFTQRNIEEAAKAAGIGANTLLRWLKVPEFEAAYRAAAARHSANPSRDSSRVLRRRLRLC